MAHILDLPFTICVTIGKLFNVCKPHFPHLGVETTKSICGFAGKLKVMVLMHGKHLPIDLICNKCLKIVA